MQGCAGRTPHTPVRRTAPHTHLCLSETGVSGLEAAILRGMAPLLFLLLAGCIESSFTKGSPAESVASGIYVSPPALSFGALPSGAAGQATVTITNTGTSSLSLLALYVDGDAAFTLIEPPTGVLEAGASVEAEVVFTADRLDAAGTLWVLSSDPSSPEVPVPLTGATEVGALVLAPSPLYVGNTAPGTDTEGVLTVTNVGHAPVTLLQEYLARDEFALLDLPSLPLVLEAQDALDLRVGFTPDVEGIYEAQLWLSADDPAGAHMVVLQGTSGDAYEEDGPEVVDDDCYEPEDGFLEYPEARFIVRDSTVPVVATYITGAGAYTNTLSVVTPAEIPIITTHVDPLGTTVELGTFPEGTELMLQLYVHDTGYTYYSGPAGRNPDGFAHVAMSYLGDCVWRVGFEDLYRGGDQDFDDAVITLSGALQLEL